MIRVPFAGINRAEAAVVSQLNFEFGCRLANPGNANLPIGVLCVGTVANREIGVPGVDSEVAASHCFERVSLN
jgi:hypothetical protein